MRFPLLARKVREIVAAAPSSRRSLVGMDDALGPNQPAKGEGADDQLADRYAIGAQLSQNDRVQTFRATDRWLDRPVVMVVETGSGGETLAETCQALASVLSPNLVDIYDRGDSATHP